MNGTPAPLSSGVINDTGGSPLADRVSGAEGGIRASFWSWVRRRREWVWIVGILLVSALAHGVNMSDYPYQENDEGTYMSQAWAVAELGELAPYTYRYDHAPLGWLQITAWTLVTGGFHAFGTVVDSGRVLMLVVQVTSTFVLYRIARSISCSALVAGFVSLAFALSAYGIYYHRRVLLDNVATIWMLFSILPLVSGRLTLSRVWISALALGVSILSKEVTVFVVPVLTYLVFYRADVVNRWFATVGWAAVVGCVVSVYVLMAALKNELFPSGTYLGGDSEHVSLMETLRLQASRGRDGGILEPGSFFWDYVGGWAGVEPLLVVVGTLCALISVLAIRRHRLVGVMGLLTFSLWAFLARGGEVIIFYLVPLLPLLALNIGLVLNLLAGATRSALRGHTRIGPILVRGGLLLAMALCFGLTAKGFIGGDTNSSLGFQERPYEVWSSRQALAQEQAIDWVRANLPTDSVIIVDNYAYTDLHDPPGRTPGFDDAHYYFPAERDPEVRDDVLGADWRNVDYVLATSTMKNDAYKPGAPLVLVSGALDHSTPVASFDTGGYPVEVRRVDKPQGWVAWEGYKERFIEDGRVVDPGREDGTTSEGQSYAMLRSVYLDDRRTFDELWSWTQANLQTGDEGLLSWKYGETGGGLAVTERSSATDADTDAALALLFAARRWEEPSYEAEALKILKGIWEEETVLVNGERVLVAGPWARGEGNSRAVVNPSYLAPYAYKIFAASDPSHPWQELADSSYNVLDLIRESPDLGGEAGLIPNWVSLDTRTGELLPAEGLGPDAGLFSYDASRVPWRLALDHLWFGDERARRTLEALTFPRRELESTGRLSAAYNPDGSPAVDYEALSMYAGVVPGLLVVDENLAQEVYDEEISGRYVEDPARGAYWGDPTNYYDQNMAWFATAVMDGSMSEPYPGG